MYGQPHTKKRFQQLSQVSWDAPLKADLLDELLQGKRQKVGGLTRKRLFQRIAESFSWYTILELLTRAELKFLLQNDVIAGLRSADLRKKYTHAQQRLQEFI